eukprot:1182689-Prorocentrum_minimum.AAC.2
MGLPGEAERSGGSGGSGGGGRRRLFQGGDSTSVPAPSAKHPPPAQAGEWAGEESDTAPPMLAKPPFSNPFSNSFSNPLAADPLGVEKRNPKVPRSTPIG